MKKFFCFILVFFVTFFFGYHYDAVYGASCTNDGYTHNLVYDITELKASDTQIKFMGYAFIDHYDNYGGKNATISVIASKSSTVGGINAGNSYTSPPGSVTYRAVDLYGTRCTAGGCLNSLNQAIYQKISSTGYGYANCNGDRNGNLTSITGGINYGTTASGELWKGGTCVIYNVGFSVAFPYQTLIDKLNVQGDDQIYFYVRVTVKYENGCSETQTSSIGVNRKACNVSGSQCSNLEYTLGKFKFAFENLSDTATVVSYRSIPLNNSFIRIADNRNYFEKDKSFTIEGYNPSQDLTKNSYGDNVSDHIVPIKKISLYKLATYGTCTSHANSDGVNCSGSEAGAYSSYVNAENPNGAYLYKNQGSVANKHSYYAYSSWVKVDGVVSLKLALAEPPIQTECSKISSWAGSDNDITKDVDCGGTQTYEMCKDIPEDDSNAISGTIYVKSESSLTNSQCSNAGGLFRSGSCYFPVTVKASVSIYQTGEYNLGKVESVEIVNGSEVREDGEVKAGQPFNFYVNGYDYASSYDNSISWINNKMWDDSTYYYLYEGFKNCQCSGGSCSCTDSNVSDDYDALYYASGISSATCSGTANTVSKCAIDDALKNRISSGSTQLDSIYTSSEYDNSSEDKKFPGEWGGSSTEVVPSPPTVTDSDGHTFDVKEIDSSYIFNLRDGYLNLQDINDIQYPATGNTLGDPYVSFGKRIYVPLKYRPGSEYSINLEKSKDSDNGISFVDGIKWGISGTCTMFVQPGLYDDPDNPTPDPSTPTDPGAPWNPSFAVKYRSIDEENPFPKATSDDDLPANWKTYKEEVGNFNRINNSYNNYPDNPDYRYEGVFDYTDSTPYTSWQNINTSGSSSFVTSNFSKYPSAGSYCPLGEYSDTCD